MPDKLPIRFSNAARAGSCIGILGGETANAGEEFIVRWMTWTVYRGEEFSFEFCGLKLIGRQHFQVPIGHPIGKGEEVLSW